MVDLLARSVYHLYTELTYSSRSVFRGPHYSAIDLSFFVDVHQLRCVNDKSYVGGIINFKVLFEVLLILLMIKLKVISLVAHKG